MVLPVLPVLPPKRKPGGPQGPSPTNRTAVVGEHPCGAPALRTFMVLPVLPRDKDKTGGP
jgi:hypothetical protein